MALAQPRAADADEARLRARIHLGLIQAQRAHGIGAEEGDTLVAVKRVSKEDAAEKPKDAKKTIAFLLIGDPIWLVAAANFTYLIGIALPSVAVWLLRRDQPDMVRPYRAPRTGRRCGASWSAPAGPLAGSSRAASRAPSVV